MSAAAAVISIIIAAVVFWLIYRFGWMFDNERRFEAELRMRPRLSDDTLIEEYFRADDIDPTIPIRVRQVFGRQFQLDHERIRPEDDFGLIYADLDFFLVVEEIEDVFGVTLSDDECAATEGTIRSVSVLVQRKRDSTLKTHCSS